MPTSPLTLTPTGGPSYAVVKGHLVMLATGPWVLDVELDASSLAQLGMPSGRVVVVFGGVPMSGTIDPSSSGTFGPTAMARVLAGGGGWSRSPPARDYHADAGVLSTTVYQATALAVGEILVDLAPAPLGVDFVVSGEGPAMAVFRDAPWWVDVTGTTYVGARPPAIPDPSLVLRDWDPIHQKLTFASDTLLLPNTPLADPRFNGSSFTVWNIEQVFDANGSTGWAWASAAAASSIAADLQAAVLYWTRAGFLRVYRYRLVQYQGGGPGGGPPRQALQAVTPAAGMPNLLPLAPWSGVAGVVSELAPSQEVLVAFENADPSLPRVVAYSLIATGGQALGLPLKTTIDASVEIAVGPSAPLVQLAGGTGGALVLASAYADLLSALATFAHVAGTSTTLANVIAAGAALSTALGALPPAPTRKTTAA